MNDTYSQQGGPDVRHVSQRIRRARRHGGVNFAALVDQETFSSARGEASSCWQAWIYTPAVTAWVFLSQCLSADHSCCEAVARLAAWRVSQGLAPCSRDTGAYCLARDVLPEDACQLGSPKGHGSISDWSPTLFNSAFNTVRSQSR
ncbi:MAG: hypothetical protein U0805_22690 [Pirellulales bacterium]